ncbi:hypothetical protein TEA_021494 [Camellia sinensis var. sinensis]|uniref:Uncharacterized protein n=1 Tax=Camellia sinensis var. sinensis TaxID=542762 RepID=A0A4V6RY83_CAMSN|nr:hypothetical protein TEA_021494 [Camellia sinensis var. sinensis]
MEEEKTTTSLERKGVAVRDLEHVVYIVVMILVVLVAALMILLYRLQEYWSPINLETGGNLETVGKFSSTRHNGDINPTSCPMILVRRLRIQQRIKSAELGILKEEQENELPDFPSFIPFLPPLSSANLKLYYASCFSLIAGIILFGGLLAPILELKLGLGGTSYEDFIRSLHLPMQLSEVDPIVASFSGGAVGVISALMVVEINNVKQQEDKRCKYCLGTGYLACARCSSSGALVLIEPESTVNARDQPLSPPKTERCSNCSGAGKVMCPTCLCTGMAMASEHDPRIDPFD